jgi:hypothetical protein
MHMQIHHALKFSESMRWFPTGIFSVGEGVELSFDVAGAVYTDDDSDPAWYHCGSCSQPFSMKILPTSLRIL